MPLRLGTSVIAVAALGCLAPPVRVERVQSLADAAGVALAHLQVSEAASSRRGWARGARRDARRDRARRPAGQVLVSERADAVAAGGWRPRAVGARRSRGVEHHDELTPAGTAGVFLARWSAPLEDGGNGDVGGSSCCAT